MPDMTDPRARIVEECFWELSELLSVERIVRDGWIQVVAQGGGDMRNGVLTAALDEDDADRVIDETIAFYAERSTPFRWHVSPSTRPSDMAERLVAHGFERVDTLAGMCISTAVDVTAPDLAITVSRLSLDDAEAFADVIFSTVYAPPAVRERLLAEIRDGRNADRQKHYAARVEGRIVGATTLALMRRGGYLQGAAVLEAFRGRGVYRQMIQARLQALRANDVELAVITARTATSAPICARAGFERVCTIDVYRHE